MCEFLCLFMPTKVASAVAFSYYNLYFLLSLYIVNVYYGNCIINACVFVCCFNNICSIRLFLYRSDNLDVGLGVGIILT